MGVLDCLYRRRLFLLARARFHSEDNDKQVMKSCKESVDSDFGFAYLHGKPDFPVNLASNVQIATLQFIIELEHVALCLQYGNS